MPRQHEAEVAIAEQARDWVVRLFAEGDGLAEHEECARWRAADVRHDAAYVRAEALWHKLGTWKALGELEPLEGNGHHRNYWLAAAAAVTAIAISAAWYMQRQEAWFAPQLSTKTAEIREITLPDGSAVTLGARSKLKLIFAEGERRVRLTGGDAFFSVVRDPQRPFLVEAGDTIVRVVGTKFDVHHGPEQVRVAVVEGAVQVLDKSEKGKSHALIAGQQVVASRDGFEPVRPVDVAKPGAWRKGRLIYVDASLAEVVADANRYFLKRIEFGEAGLAQLRLTTAFRTNQIDEMVDALERALPVKADRSRADAIVLRPVEHD